MKESSIDFISNTSTLEHIPVGDLVKILNENYRILKKGGLVSCIIDLQDHSSYFDKTISIYNFLKYSPQLWKIFNSSLHYQNRLRYPDYIQLFKKTGFKLLEVKKYEPSPFYLNELKHLTIDSFFKENYSYDELGVTHMDVVMSK